MARLAGHSLTGNIALATARGHHTIMRRLVLASTLILAGCATRPQPQQPAQQIPPPEPVSPQARQILGLTPNELVGHFGKPALQIREGNSLKLQFRGRSCVLDAYLYPQSGGYRVTHVDTRSPSGVDMDQAACIFALENPS
jgi:pimeloyl-ACP methyl ester carboxylesterase